jgi:DNA-binding transcriptional LysR family regulator
VSSERVRVAWRFTRRCGRARAFTPIRATGDFAYDGIAAERLHIAAPSLSQQIKTLEASVGASLFVRDPCHVELTAAGSTLLPDAREILARAAAAQRRLAGTTGPLRLGYVSWLPDELLASVRSELRIDEWVMPSHIQIARVLDGGLDAAIAWAAQADERLHHQLLWPEPLVAVTPRAHTAETVAAHAVRVLVDADLTSWDAWNQFAGDVAYWLKSRVVRVDDGGITGPPSMSIAAGWPYPFSNHPSAGQCRPLRPADQAGRPDAALVLVPRHLG